MRYQRKVLSTGENVGGPAVLPEDLQGLADVSLADLSWASPALGYSDTGFFPVPDPEPEPVPVEPRKIHAVIFKQRFTADERKAIRAAAKVNDDVEDWLDLVNTATEVYLDLPETVSALSAIEAAGLLAPGRAAEILA